MAPAAKYSHQEQEEIILNAAAEVIAESSLIDFTMSAVGKIAGLSMGSLYKHVQCKEDLIFALATRVFKQHRDAFQKVLDSQLTTPEKIIAITLLSPEKVQVYPFDSQLEAFAANEAVIRKASPLWTERMIAASESCKEAFYNCVHGAVVQGELKLRGDITAAIDQINLGCWALTVGYQQVQRIIQIKQITEGTDSLNEAVALDDPIVNSLRNLLNSYPWQKPLDDESLENASSFLQSLNLR